MSFDNRQQQNLSQRASNEVLDKTLRKGPSLLHPKDKTLISNVDLKSRTPFLFFPQISNFQAGTNGSILSRVREFLNVLSQFPLSLEVPPQSISYEFVKQKSAPERTLSGWVEWHWGEQIDTISAQMSTGAFINIETGLAEGPDRRASYSYINYENLIRLYKNNGAIYDDFGKVMLFSGLFLINDLGVFSGYFNNLNVTESGDQPFRFNVSWSFRVKSVIHFFTNF